MQGIWTAVISGLCVAVPSVLATISSNKRNNDLVLYRIEELDKRVSKHNNVVERMFKAEERISLLENEVGDIKGAR